MLLEHAAAHPDDLALDDLVRQRTWGALIDRAQRLGALMRQHAPIGGVVASRTRNRVEVLELALAATLAGAWWTPLDHHRGESALREIIADAQPKLLIPDDVPAGEPTAAVIPVGAALDAALAGLTPRPIALDAPAGGILRYTSGSTGRPRGVLRWQPPTVGDVLAHGAARARALGVPSGPHLVTGPLSHAAPLGFAWMALAVGAPVIMMPRWDSRQALALLRERRIASTHMVPTMFRRLLALPATERARCPAPARVFHGAAPVSQDEKRAMIGWWGDAVVEYWGCSETGVVTLSEAADWLARPGTVGRALPGREVVAIGGRLHVRGGVERLFSYWRDPAATAAAHPAPGLIRTGDRGRVDDGDVFLDGRADRVLICGGVNISPEAVEAVIQAMPGVAAARVEGIGDVDLGQVVGAAVAGDVSREDVAAWCAERLTGLERPRRIVVLAELPHTPAGKVDRAAILRQLTAPDCRTETGGRGA